MRRRQSSGTKRWARTAKNWVREEAEVHIDIAALAMACGITRVIATGHPDRVDPLLGSSRPNRSKSRTWARTATGTEASSTRKKRALLHEYQTSLMLRLWEALDLYPSANGSVADDSLIMAFATTGESHHNGSYTLQAMLIGDGGGAITPSGYLKLPDSPFLRKRPTR